MNVQRLLVERIDPDPDQPRQEQEISELKRLALSIRDRGLLQPPIVFSQGDRFQLVDGHRRIAAIRLLGQADVPAIVLAEKPSAETRLETQLTANCLRLDMSPTDKARAYQRLMTLRGWSNVELAAHLHVSKGAVTQCLSYLKLPADAQADLDAGVLAESTAYAIARAADEETKQTLLAAARKGELSRNDAQAAVRKRAPSAHAVKRCAFAISGCTVTVTSPDALAIHDLLALWQCLIAESKRAMSKKWDVATLTRVLVDESRQVDAESVK